MGFCCSKPAPPPPADDRPDEPTETTRLLPPAPQPPAAPPLTPQERLALERRDEWNRIVARTSEAFLDISAARSAGRPPAGVPVQEREAREARYRTKLLSTTPPDLSMLDSDDGRSVVRPAPLWEVEEVPGGVLQPL